MAAEYPSKRVEFVRAVAEGDYMVFTVARRGREIRSTPALTSSRLDAAGDVVEHWDVLQVIPDDSANDNGML